MSQAEILITNLQSNGVKIFVNDGKLKIDAPKNGLTEETKKLLSTHKAEIIRQLTERKTDKLHERLNRMIAAGVRFQVSGDEFLTEDQGQILTTEDHFFLELHKPEILACFHYNLEKRNRDDDHSDQAEELKAEREAIMMFDGQPSEIHLDLTAETIEIINARCAEWDRTGRTTATKFKWCEAALF